MRRLVLYMLGCALLAASAISTAAEPRSSDATEQDRLAGVGLSIVKAKCARCHAIAMDDKSPHDKAPPFREVVLHYPSENLAEALAEGIVSGHPDMPVFVFETEEIEGFIAYLDSLSPPAVSPPGPAPAPSPK